MSDEAISSATFRGAQDYMNAMSASKTRVLGALQNELVSSEKQREEQERLMHKHLGALATAQHMSNMLRVKIVLPDMTSLSATVQDDMRAVAATKKAT